MKKLFLLLLLVASLCVNTFAEVKLPDGYVKGLPEDLAVMDESGYSPDGDNGELFISIENMKPGTTYTKDVSITNLRTDAQYSIYMTATPNYSTGNVDMLNETTCKLYLDDELIYEGLVNGDGSPNMQENGLDLGGTYKSGQSKTLHAEFVWDWSGKTSYDMDNNGYYGEVSFIWTFYAAVKNNGGNPSSGDDTGSNSGHKTTQTVTESITYPSNEEEDEDTPSEDTSSSSSGDSDSDSDSKEKTDNPGIKKDDVIVEPTVSDITQDDDSDNDKPGIIKKIVDKIPFIPENVKTGFESFLDEYTAVAVISFGAALALIIVIVVKSIKLKKLKEH